jgi:hypothetical protein
VTVIEHLRVTIAKRGERTDLDTVSKLKQSECSNIWHISSVIVAPELF